MNDDNIARRHRFDPHYQPLQAADRWWILSIVGACLLFWLGLFAWLAWGNP